MSNRLRTTAWCHPQVLVGVFSGPDRSKLRLGVAPIYHPGRDKALGLRIAAVVAAMLLGVGAAVAADRVETVDGRCVQGQVLSVAGQVMKISDGNAAATLPLTEVSEIVLGEGADVMAQAGRTVVVAAGGETFVAAKLTAADGTMKFENYSLGPCSLSLRQVLAVYLPAPTQTADQAARKCKEFAASDQGGDLLVADQQGKDWTPVDGALVSISADKVTFHWQDEDRQIERKNVRAVLFAGPAGSPATAPGRAAVGTILLHDGSTLAFAAIEWSGDLLTVQAVNLGEKKIARRLISAVRFRWPGVSCLGDLTPCDVQEYGFLDATFPHRLNRSVSGGPLCLGGKSYAAGLGLNSYTKLSYLLEGQYRFFVATVGIDDSVRPWGNATLTFLGDGKELAKPLVLTGRDEPQTVRLALAGVKTFTLVVDFGPDHLGVGDHVDIAVARLVK